MKCKLLLPCIECDDARRLAGKAAVMVTLATDLDTLSRELAAQSWLLSSLTPPGQGKTPILFSALCPECAKRVYPPEVLEAAKKALKL